MLTQEQINAVEDYVNALAEEYAAEQKEKGPRWWEFWKKIPSSKIHQVVKFLLKSLDGLIQYVEPIIPAGADKKAVVMMAVTKLFDFTVKEIMPFWLRPFVPAIKAFVINVVVGNAIDFLVSKYNEGAMVPKEENGTEEENQQPTNG